MQHILNNLSIIKKTDKQNMLSSIELMPKQINSAIQDFQKIKLPNWKNIKNIVVCGMGGSALGAHISKSLYLANFKIPFEIVNNYTLPGWVAKDTLCIIISYSGNTEEPLNALTEASHRKALIFSITSGGKLMQLIKSKKTNGYIFNNQFNICKEPRMGLGYTMFSLLLLLKNLNIIDLSDNEVEKIFPVLQKNINQFGITAQKNNKAKEIANSLKNFIPILLASDFLIGSAHTFTNQINENAKTFASYFPIPEINHHLMEGLSFPKNKNILKFLLLKSRFYEPRNLIRHAITEKVLRKNKIKYITYECEGNNKLSQIFEILIFGSYAAFYLGILNKINPSPVPNVAFFKTELAKINKIS